VFFIPEKGSIRTMRTIALASLIVLFNAPANAQGLQVGGRFGYLGEYELSAEVTAKVSDGRREFSGPMIVKHVGLCTHSGSNQSDGQIRLQFTDMTSRVAATLLFDGQKCTYSGRMSNSDVGELVCSGAPVPFSIWSK
jgi:hypothetical protein